MLVLSYSTLLLYLLRLIHQGEVGHLTSLLPSHLSAKLSCFGFLCNLSSPSPALFCCCIFMNSLPVSQPFQFSCYGCLSVREKEHQKKECGLEELLAKGTMRERLVSGLIWIQSPKWRRYWRCWLSKLCDENCETWKQAPAKLPPALFFLDQVAGLGFKFELVSFQAAVTLIFCSIFSIWLHFFYITTGYNIRTGDP